MSLEKPTTSELEAKLYKLRVLWKENPTMRPTIELQARAIKCAIALKKTNMEYSNDPEVRRIAKALF